MYATHTHTHFLSVSTYSWLFTPQAVSREGKQKSDWFICVGSTLSWSRGCRAHLNFETLTTPGQIQTCSRSQKKARKTFLKRLLAYSFVFRLPLFSCLLSLTWRVDPCSPFPGFPACILIGSSWQEGAGVGDMTSDPRPSSTGPAVTSRGMV